MIFVSNVTIECGRCRAFADVNIGWAGVEPDYTESLFRRVAAESLKLGSSCTQRFGISKAICPKCALASRP